MSDNLNSHRIQLTQGQSALVSSEDYEAVAANKWHAVLCQRRWYARRSLKVAGKMKVIYMHRQIMGLGGDKEIVDHINGDGLNNTRQNLRITTYSQNNMNIQVTRAKTGIRGVYLQHGGYVVRIARAYFGSYPTGIEAAFHANRALDLLSPSAGMRNEIDKGELLAVWRKRKAEIDDLINQVAEVAP